MSYQAVGKIKVRSYLSLTSCEGPPKLLSLGFSSCSPHPRGEAKANIGKDTALAVRTEILCEASQRFARLVYDILLIRRLSACFVGGTISWSSSHADLNDTKAIAFAALRSLRCDAVSVASQFFMPQPHVLKAPFLIGRFWTTEIKAHHVLEQSIGNSNRLVKEA